MLSCPITPEVAAAAGVSYRQLDYWVRQRYVAPAKLATGSGTGHAWDPASIGRVIAMAALVRVGYQPAAAARLIDVAPPDEPDFDLSAEGLLDAGEA